MPCELFGEINSNSPNPKNSIVLTEKLPLGTHRKVKEVSRRDILQQEAVRVAVERLANNCLERTRVNKQTLKRPGLCFS